MVRPERRQDRRLGDHGGRTGGLRPSAPCRRPGADRVLARRRRHRRAQRHQADQSAEGKDHRVGAVHRGRFLHPLPGAGGRAADQSARQPRREPPPRALERRLHRGRVRRGRSVPQRHQVGQEPSGGLRHVGTEGVRGRERERRQGARAHDQPESADRRRHPHRASRVRPGTPEDRSRARAVAARGQSHGARSAGSVCRHHRPRLQVGPRQDQA